MPKKPVTIATHEFESQGDANAFFKEMLNRYEPGGRVSDEDALHLGALLERHSEYADKVGVDHFEVMIEHGTQCFRIVRADGTGTDFSYGHCIRGRPPSRKSEVSHAFRQVVRFDLYRARDAFLAACRGADGLVSCAVIKQPIAPDQGHMVHRPPLTFEVIVTTFLEASGLSYDVVPITDGPGEQVAPSLTDKNMADDFRGCHAGVARLDLSVIR